MWNRRAYWIKFFSVFLLIPVSHVVVSFALDPRQNGVARIVTHSKKLTTALAALCLTSLFLAWLWQKLIRSERLHLLTQTFLAFSIAFFISVYGAAKLLKTQLYAPEFVLDKPVSALSGFWRTWTFFSYSPTLVNILGCIQIGGAILLLFRQTRLLGAFVLLPVMVNINLINHFYHISPVAYYNAMLYTLVLLYFLWLNLDKLKSLFFPYAEPFKFGLKLLAINALRVLVIGGAFYSIYNLKKERGIADPSVLDGVWQVQSITKAGNVSDPAACQDSVWSKLYFDQLYGVMFKYHPDRFQQKDLRGDYEVDNSNQVLSITLKRPVSQTMDWKYQFENDSSLRISGVYNRDSFQMSLNRIKK